MTLHHMPATTADRPPEDRGLHRIRLIRKLALQLNGFDLSAFSVGQILSVPRPQATMLIEGWAEPAAD